jgi:hypothetical protein
MMVYMEIRFPHFLLAYSKIFAYIHAHKQAHTHMHRRLNGNQVPTLPPGIFQGLTKLEEL